MSAPDGLSPAVGVSARNVHAMLNHRATSELHKSLIDARLGQAQILDCSGISRHFERLASGETDSATLAQYAEDLAALCALSREGGEEIPGSFWDVPPKTETPWPDEYSAARAFVTEYPDYIRLLGTSFHRFVENQECRQPSAVSIALSILADVSAYVASGASVVMTESRGGLCADQQAMFLWQQILTGSSRQIPYIHRDAYTHGPWARHNVVEMWRYRIGAQISVDEAWGLTGFSDRFVGDATNTNQIEHMAISAVAQSVLRIPVLLLDVLEEMEWLLRKGTRAASRADEQVNRAVAHCLLPEFCANNPRPACARLEQELAS